MRSWAATRDCGICELSSSLKQKIHGSSVISISLRSMIDNLDEAFDIIRAEWTRIEYDYNAKNAENTQDPHVQGDSFGIYPR
jgi:hypothetical protein